ncbi:MAG TPA: FAD-dependent oxidoreductase [Acidimicrobiales bacterium]|nr:FAD-dependent oxidoreductase [Acidimicrobiales bacterium]
MLRSVVVVGASLAGLKACEGLRRGGFAGSIALVGAESHLPYDRPPLSKEFLAGKSPFERLALTTEGKLADLDLDLELGARARAVDPARRVVRLESGRELPFEGLVIATGATPRRLRPGGDLEGVLTLRRLEDALRLRDLLEVGGVRLVVVGGGFLGMEVAATARGLGAEVTVVEPQPAPLARVVGPLVGRALTEAHAEHGVRLRTGVGVTALVGESRVEGVRLDDGSLIAADVVLVAVGVVPETGWLEGSGLDLADGVRCGPSLLAAPGVVAAGDVARWPHPLAGGLIRLEHRTNAAEQGAHAAASLLAGPGAPAFTSVPYFWSDQFDLKIQSIGIPGPLDEVRVVAGSIAERRFVACYGRAGRLSAVVAFGRPRQLMAFRGLLERRAPLEEALRVELD